MQRPYRGDNAVTARAVAPCLLAVRDPCGRRAMAMVVDDELMPDDGSRRELDKDG